MWHVEIHEWQAWWVLCVWLHVILYITPLIICKSISFDHVEQIQHLYISVCLKHTSDDYDESSGTFRQSALTGSISQIHSCGKNSAVTMSSGTSKAIRKTITAVSQARRPAKEGEGERLIENQVEENTERKGRQRGENVRAFSSKSPHNSRQTHGKASLWSRL